MTVNNVAEFPSLVGSKTSEVNIIKTCSYLSRIDESKPLKSTPQDVNAHIIKCTMIRIDARHLQTISHHQMKIDFLTILSPVRPLELDSRIVFD